jgi:hypothetical protein
MNPIFTCSIDIVLLPDYSDTSHKYNPITGPFVTLTPSSHLLRKVVQARVTSELREGRGVSNFYDQAVENYNEGVKITHNKEIPRI